MSGIILFIPPYFTICYYFFMHTPVTLCFKHSFFLFSLALLELAHKICCLFYKLWLNVVTYPRCRGLWKNVFSAIFAPWCALFYFTTSEIVHRYNCVKVIHTYISSILYLVILFICVETSGLADFYGLKVDGRQISNPSWAIIVFHLHDIYTDTGFYGTKSQETCLK